MTAHLFTAIDLDEVTQIRVAILPLPPYGAQITLSARPLETFDDKDIRRSLEPRFVRQLVEALRPGMVSPAQTAGGSSPEPPMLADDYAGSLLSPAEHDALALIDRAWNLINFEIIGADRPWPQDAEAIRSHLAAVANAIKAQAAARAFPHRYTLLGRLNR